MVREKRDMGVYEQKARKALSRRSVVKTGVYTGIGATLGHIYDSVASLLGWGGRKISELEKHYVDSRARGDNAYLEKTGRLEKSDSPGAKEFAKVRRTTDKVENWRSRFLRRIFGRTDEDTRDAREKRGIGEYAPDYKAKSSDRPIYPGQKSPAAKTSVPVKKSESKPVDRRGFFSELFGWAHRNPRTAGAAVGGIVGGVKASRNYDPQGKIVNARSLDVQMAGHGVVEENTRALESLAGELKEVRQRKRSPEHPDEEYGGRFLFILGILGIIASIILSSVQITGFSISGNPYSNLNFANVVIFFVSVALLFIAKFL